MRFLIAIGMAFFAAATVLAQDFPGDVEGKGTIGLVCLDSAGTYHFWYSQNKADFDACVDQVVQAWTAKNSTVQPAHGPDASAPASINDLIQGMASYRQSVVRAKAARTATEN